MFRGLLKGSKVPSILILAYFFVFSITLTSLQGITTTNINDFLIKDNLEQINPVNQISNLLEDLSSYPYIPVTNVSGTGDTFDVDDILTVYDDFSLNLTFNSLTGYFEDNFTNVDISSAYDSFLLNYNMTHILAKQDFYPIELEEDGDDYLDSTKYALAQSFNVPWEYTMFYGAQMYLSTNGVNTGTCDFEIVVVKAEEISGQPNMSEIFSSAVDGPFNSTNPIISGFNYYDFTDEVLNQGKYYVVLIVTGDLSVVGPKFNFWHSNSISPYLGDTYYMTNLYSWNQLSSIDFTLNVEMLPSNQTGYAMEFQDLSTITIKDNGVDILDIDSQITSIGFHNLTSDTSLELTFNNSYNFINSITADSYFAAFNSTAGDYSILWNLTWDVSSVDPYPYSIYERMIQVATMSDWYDSPICYYNDTDTFPAIFASDTYLCYLDTNISAGSFRLDTSSPNFIQSLELSDGEELTNLYSLGHWTTDGIDATGYEGSTIYSTITLIENSISGTLNFSLFNPEGEIIPLKTSLPINLTYNDLSSYTLLNPTPDSPGLYSSEITLDPSVYGSDLEGIWTAFVCWENGSEVGIFSQQVYIQALTNFHVEWEEIPANNNWINDVNQAIVRQNGHELYLNSSYYKLSEPFFTSYGKLIENTTIGYLTSWGDSGNLTSYDDIHNITFNINITAHSYTIELTTAGILLENHHVELNLEVFNVFSVEIIQTSLEANDSDDLFLSFRLINETDANNISMEVSKSELSMMIQGEAIAQEDYFVTYEDGNNTVVISADAIRFDDFDLSLNISKSHFKSSYNNEKLETTFDVLINEVIDPPDPPTTPPYTPPLTDPEFPPYLIGIIIGASIALIGIISIIAVVGNKRAKGKGVIVDISEGSNVVSLFESILSLSKILFIDNETSLPVFEYDIEYKKTVDTTLITGFLSVVAEMGKQIGGIGTGGIKKLEYRNFVVNNASAENYSVFIFSSDEINNELTARLFDLIMWFEYTFAFEGTWDGRMDVFVQKKSLIEDKIAENLFVWVFFPLQLNTKKIKEIKKLKDINVKIANHIVKTESVTVSSLITEFQNVELDEILNTIFTLVNNKCLLRKRFI
ncbi:MAG: hypothetical protein ACTSWJ_10565 [Candidatus Heimdallarchaeaceae archaeon]